MALPPPRGAETTAAAAHGRPGEVQRTRSWLRGGPEGNEELTATTSVVLLILLAVLGVTILRIGQLISVHLFVGLLLIGPVGLKMASAGYRFVHYYRGDAAYLQKGPPETWLRMLAPVVVVTTVVVFGSGVILLFDGPSHRDTMLLIHKLSFIAWLVCTGLHVIGHLPGLPAALRAGSRDPARIPGHDSGGAGRAIALAGALIGGLVLAMVLIPDFSVWTSATAFAHHRG